MKTRFWEILVPPTHKTTPTCRDACLPTSRHFGVQARALSGDECVIGVCANPEPRYCCFGGFRHRRITLRSLDDCTPQRCSAQGRRRVFRGGTTGFAREAPWGFRTVYPELVGG